MFKRENTAYFYTNLNNNDKKRGGRLITAIRNNTDDTSISRAKITRNQKCDKKQLYGHSKQRTSGISHEKTWKWLKKGSLKRETESLVIAELNNAIKTNYVKAKTGKTQQNSRVSNEETETK